MSLVLGLDAKLYIDESAGYAGPDWGLVNNAMDVTLNLETARIQKLHIRKSILQAWLGTSLIVDRTQIIDITPQQITVREATLKSGILGAEPVPEIPS